MCFVQWFNPPCTLLYDPSLSTLSLLVLIVLRCSWLNVLHHWVSTLWSDAFFLSYSLIWRNNPYKNLPNFDLIYCLIDAMIWNISCQLYISHPASFRFPIRSKALVFILRDNLFVCLTIMFRFTSDPYIFRQLSNHFPMIKRNILLWWNCTAHCVYLKRIFVGLESVTKATKYRYSSGVICPSFLPLRWGVFVFVCEFIVQNQVQFVNNLPFIFIIIWIFWRL